MQNSRLLSSGCPVTADWLKRTAAGIAELHPYIPGKPIVELERELGLVDTIKLASNENPLGPSPLAWAAIQKVAGEVHLYPDDSGHTLRHKLAGCCAVVPQAITLGAGSSDVIDMVARVFLEPGVNAVYSEHSFAMYQIYTQACGAAAKIAPPLPVDHSHMPYGHDLDAMAALIDNHTRVVFIANPNNPTGTWLRPSALEKLFDKIPENIIIVLDLAYTEYMDEDIKPPIKQWLEKFPNLVVTQTFSKVYALAGLRIGYSMSNSEIADILNRVRQPFNTNTLAQAAAVASLDDIEHVGKSVTMNNAGKVFLQNAFNEMELNYLPTMGNFISVNVKQDGLALYEKLLQQGVIVRPVANYDMPEYLRVTIGRQQQNERFIETLKQCL